MRPVIGIVPLYDAEKQSIWMLPGYPEHIERAGGIPLILPLTRDPDVLHEAMLHCQGLLLTGGQDVSPLLYGEEPLPECGEICAVRDAMEGILLRYALAEDLPVLGICRGIQFLNVFCGGTLWQDLPTQRPTGTEHHMSPPYDRAVHAVEMLSDTPLQSILGCRTLGVNSYHHQAIRTLGEGLQITAVSEDGLAEGVCMPAHWFVHAVQWHPELREDAASRRIFEAFIGKAEGLL